MTRRPRIQNARRTAENLIDRFQINSSPVDVNYIAKSLGLQVVYNALGDDISGLLVTRDGTAAVCVKESDPLVRQRFTIAHEIGHFCLKHQELGDHVHVDEGWKVSARSTHTTTGLDPMEVEANQFAAALLMPGSLVRERAQDFGTTQLDDLHVSALAKEFKVSEQAMAIRLSVLGL